MNCVLMTVVVSALAKSISLSSSVIHNMNYSSSVWEKKVSPCIGRVNM